ncbi:MAG: enoyl-CoA hydratase/isomerase family protein [Phycisphaerales bacterium]
MPELATLQREGPIARLTLNRPDKRNALSLDLLEALLHHAQALHAQPDNTTVCILSGQGPAFCAGMDLKAVLNEPGAPLRLLSAIAELSIAIRTLPMVVLAKAHGAAIGGGCGLIAVADIAITHPDAKLGYPEVDLGVCPAVVAPWLVQRVGPGRARRILLAGGLLTGHQALELGLVDESIERAALDERCEALAANLAKSGVQAVRATKALLNDLETPDIHDAVRRGAHISAEVIAGPEAQERLSKIYA